MKYFILICALVLFGFSASSAQYYVEEIGTEAGSSLLVGDNGIIAASSAASISDNGNVGVFASEFCGDGIKSNFEACDGSDFGSFSCSTFGFNQGTLSCTSDCGITTSLCSNSAPASSQGGGGGGGGSLPSDLTNVSGFILYNETYYGFNLNGSLEQMVLGWYAFHNITGNASITVFLPNGTIALFTDGLMLRPLIDTTGENVPVSFKNPFEPKTWLLITVGLLLAAYVAFLSEKKKAKKKRDAQDDEKRKVINEIEAKMARTIDGKP